MLILPKLKSLLFLRKQKHSFVCQLLFERAKSIPKISFDLESERTLKPFSEIPGPRRIPLVGNLHLFNRFGPYSFEKLYDAYEDLHKMYGPIVRLDLGITIIALFDPGDIKTLFSLDGPYPIRPVFEALKHYRLKRKDLYSSAGLVTENGKEWKRLRESVNFIMEPKFARSYFNSQAIIAEDFINRIQISKDHAGNVNFLQEVYRFSEEAFGLVCFGTRLGLLQRNSIQSEKLIKAADDTMQAMADTLLGFPWWKLFNTPTYSKLVQSQNFFQSFAMECIKKAKSSINGVQKKEDANLLFFTRLLENTSLKLRDISLLMTEMFSAGIDATGNSIGYLLYNLTKRPDAQERLYQEIIENVSNNMSLTLEAVDNMKYLKACVKESFRLTPTSGGTARILRSPGVFSGYEVPGNVLCIGINPVICRQSQHFVDPLEFKPERWLDDKSKRLLNVGHPYCIMPFSHGVRRCVGQRFAEQEIKLCIIKIIQNFRVEYDGPEIQSKMRMLLVPAQPLNFKFVNR